MIDLRDDGTVALDVTVGDDRAEHTIVLRRPDVDEFFGLWSSIDVLGERQRGYVAVMTRRDDETNEDGEVTVPAATQEERRDATRQLFESNVEWLTSVVDMLAVNRPDGQIHYPSWVAATGLATPILAHWQNVPLARGGQIVTTPTVPPADATADD